MSNVIVRFSCGYVGTDSDYDTGYTLEEWQDVSEEEKNEIVEQLIWEYAEASFMDGKGNYIE